MPKALQDDNVAIFIKYRGHNAAPAALVRDHLIVNYHI